MVSIKRSVVHVYHTFLQLIVQSRLYRWTAILSVVLVAIMVVLPLWKVLPLAEQQQFMPLHYNIYFGIDRFGPWYQIFVLPALGFSLLIINTVFQAVFYHRERVISHFFAITTIVAETALFISMVFVVLLNL